MLIFKKSKKHITDRGVHFLLHKTTKKVEYWPRLTKSIKKEHFIRTDFDKVSSHQPRPLLPPSHPNASIVLTFQWVDEDEQDGDANDPLSSYNFGAGGMPDMGDLDFSKLGGGLGDTPGLGDTMGGDEDASDGSDDDMPDLTTTEEATHVTGATTAAAEEGEGKGEETAS